MRWPWKTAADTAEANEHKREIADVTERLDVVADRFEEVADRFDDQLAVLEQNGDEA